jgi:hypothetical protein
LKVVKADQIKAEKVAKKQEATELQSSIEAQQQQYTEAEFHIHDLEDKIKKLQGGVDTYARCCFCKSGDDDVDMIACDGGDDAACIGQGWYHLECIGMSWLKSNSLDRWVCPFCKARSAQN